MVLGTNSTALNRGRAHRSKMINDRSVMSVALPLSFWGASISTPFVASASNHLSGGCPDHHDKAC